MAGGVTAQVRQGGASRERTQALRRGAERRQDEARQIRQEAARLSGEARQEQKPGFFRRVWNWIKGAFSRLFSRKSNTETVSGGDAAESFAQTQADAPAPNPILGSLPPERTPRRSSRPPTRLERPEEQRGSGRERRNCPRLQGRLQFRRFRRAGP